MRLTFSIILIFFTAQIIAQNVGQAGDSILNYTDINGYKQGFWQQKYYNGKIKYEGFFRNNMPYGEFKRYDNRGRITSILIYSEKGDTANATLFHENKKVAATGRYINKIKNGEWKYYSEEGSLLKLENVIGEIKNGPYKTYYLDGKIYEEKFYINNILDGENIRYYSNGQMNFKSFYKLGRRVGAFFVYNIDGSVLVYGKYVDDKRHGIWRFYEESGRLQTEINYNYGIPDNKDEMEIKETERIKKLEENKDLIDDPGNFIENPEQFIFMKREKR
jgi:antitoxin component YwqK of YwqJK toxin-antitoxin module